MTLTPELMRLNEILEDAAERDLARSSPRRRRTAVRRRVVLSVAALAVFAGGAAAITSQFLSGDQVAAGLPLGSAVFQGTNPACTPAGEESYDCLLSTPPTVGYAEGGWAGTKFSFLDDQKRVAGGCVGADAAGLRWSCFLGESAIEHEVVDREYLGQLVPEPGHG